MRGIIATVLVFAACDVPPPEGNECRVGQVGCSCTVSGTCGDGLACVGDLCTCAERTADCNLDAGDGCEVDLRTDSSNCGACGQACATCLDGQCVEMLASDQPMPIDVEVDATHVFWLNQGSTDAFGNPAGDGAIARVALAGGEPEVLVTGIGVPERLCQDETHLYWIDNDNFTGTHATTLNRVRKDGSDPQVLVELGAHWTTEIVVGEDYLYWPSPFMDVLLERIAKDGSGGREIFLSGVDGIWTLAQDVDNVYGLRWGPMDLLLVTAPKDGSASSELALGMMDPPRAMVSDGTSLFWIAEMEMCVAHRMHLDGSNPLTLSHPLEHDGMAAMATCDRLVLAGDSIVWLASFDIYEGAGVRREFQLIETPKLPNDSATILGFSNGSNSWPGADVAVGDAGLVVSVAGVAENADGFVFRVQP